MFPARPLSTELFLTFVNIWYPLYYS